MTKQILTGEFSSRQALVRDRLTTDAVIPHFSRPFVLADVALDPANKRRFFNFSGDLSGRYIEALAGLPTAGMGVDLPELVAELLQHQQADGRFGRTDLLFVADQIADQHMALLWGNGRLLVGLTTYFLEHGNEAVLRAAQQLGDFLLTTADACARPEVQQRLSGLGAFGFICFTQLNEGLVLLTRCTGNADYAARAAAIYPLLPPPGDQHSHGYLTTLRGVMMQYELTGDDAHLRFAIDKYRDLVNSSDYLVWGGVKEYFGDAPLENRDEGCSEADFLRLSLQLYRATNDGSYLEKAERCLFNAFYFNQYDTGDFGHHHCNPDSSGFRPNYRHCAWWCCTMHGLRAFTDVRQYAIYQKNEQVFVDLFLDGQFETDSLAVAVAKTGGDYAFTITPNVDQPVQLRIRVPGWAESCAIWVNDKPADPMTDADRRAGYWSLTKHWQPGDVVRVAFTYRLTVADETRTNSPLVSVGDAPRKLALFCGPYLLVADDQADVTFMAEPLWENIVYLNSLTAAPPATGTDLSEAYYQAEYKHEGFPGTFRTTLRPMSEISRGARGYVMAWLWFVSGQNRDENRTSAATNIPAGAYAMLTAAN